MIKFSVKDEVVTLNIQHGAPIATWSSNFKFETSSEFYAKLMSDNLEKELERRIKELRREEYEHGWNDAKKKNPKCDYFTGYF
jgi:hypothetical protein